MHTQGVISPDDRLLISGIQHFAFCRRQWALIHIEQRWEENYFTADGRLMHERADNPFFTEKRGKLIISRAMPVCSIAYGMAGKCDIVEFTENSDGVRIVGYDGLWMPRPVEYKRGKGNENNANYLQLCAEAICLEEMFSCVPIPFGYLYHAETKRREEVALDEELREQVSKALREMRYLYDRGYTPKVKPSAKCRSCSLNSICLPKLQKYRTVAEYTDGIWEDDS